MQSEQKKQILQKCIGLFTVQINVFVDILLYTIKNVM